jgi:hypothetical protein
MHIGENDERTSGKFLSESERIIDGPRIEVIGYAFPDDYLLSYIAMH